MFSKPNLRHSTGSLKIASRPVFSPARSQFRVMSRSMNKQVDQYSLRSVANCLTPREVVPGDNGRDEKNEKDCPTDHIGDSGAHGSPGPPIYCPPRFYPLSRSLRHRRLPFTANRKLWPCAARRSNSFEQAAHGWTTSLARGKADSRGCET